MTHWRALRLVLAVFMPASVLADVSEDLLAAVRKGDVAQVRTLLQRGADVNAKSPYGSTGLFFAADRGNVEMVKLLIDHGADVNTKDTFYGATALVWACEKQRVEIIRLLLSKGAKEAGDVLSTGVEKGNKEMVSLALEHKTDIPAESLAEALAQATRDNHSDIAELLKAAGVKPPVHPNFPVPPEVLKSYAGSYFLSDYEVKVDLVDGKLLAGWVGEKMATLDPVDQTTFQHSEYASLKFSFQLDNGKVASLTVRQGDGQPRVYRRAEAK